MTFESKASMLHERMTARLRLRHLRLLATLARSSTLQNAATEIGMTQPAASQALREIEDLLEIRLFDRHARGLMPTEAGRIISEQSRQILGSVHHTAEALAASTLGLQRPLQVGAIPAAMYSLVRPRMAVLRQRLAGVKLSVHECTPEEALSLMQAGTTQLALMRRPEHELGHRLTFTQLLEDELIVVASPEHPANRRRLSDLVDLKAFAWSMPLGTLRSAEVFQLACRDAGFVPIRAEMQSISPALLLSIVEDAQTLVAAPRSLVSMWTETRKIKQVRLRRKIPLPPLGALHPADEASKTIKMFIECLQSERPAEAS